METAAPTFCWYEAPHASSRPTRSFLPMNILVIGGTRFFGKTLVDRLVSAGHAVTVLSRGRIAPPAGAAHVVADRADPAALAAALAGRTFDAVIDNVAMTAEHVRAALDALGAGVGHYVLTTSLAVYGDVSSGRQWRESDIGIADLEQPPPDGHPYTIGKRGAELVLFRGEYPRVPFTILRPGYVVGPHDHLRRMQFFLQRLDDGGPIVLPTGAAEIFQLAWHADVAAAFARVLGDQTTFGRAYNVAGHELFTYPTLVRALAAAAGRKIACVEVPRGLLRRGMLAAHELPFGEDGSMWACDVGRLHHDLGITGTPSATWLSELAHAPIPELPASERVARAVEIECARRLGRWLPHPPSRLRS
ncbi:putative reductase [Minicystis rosea]|nr:putative reductase [Minicystis rosea]